MVVVVVFFTNIVYPHNLGVSMLYFGGLAGFYIPCNSWVISDVKYTKCN